MILEVKAKPLRDFHLPPPMKGTSGAAGYDLVAAIEKEIILHAGETLLVPCGFAMEIPQGYVGLVCPRSGLALKHGITILNSPGVIDSDYRGELHIMLHMVRPYKPTGMTMDIYIPEVENPSYIIKPLERIGQLLIMPVENQWTTAWVADLPDSKRGSGGFGSTGKV